MFFLKKGKMYGSQHFNYTFIAFDANLLNNEYLNNFQHKFELVLDITKQRW